MCYAFCIVLGLYLIASAFCGYTLIGCIWNNLLRFGYFTYWIKIWLLFFNIFILKFWNLLKLNKNIKLLFLQFFNFTKNYKIMVLIFLSN